MTDPTQDPSKDDASPDEIDWAAAMAEQAEGLADAADDWASALAEQTAAEASSRADESPADSSAAPGVESNVAPATGVFKPLMDTPADGNSDIEMIMDIPVQLTVELGRTRLTIRNILQLGQGSVVELDGLAGEPMDIFVNGYLIAQGEVVVVDEKYGIRVTDIITPADRINRLRSRR